MSNVYKQIAQAITNIEKDTHSAYLPKKPMFLTFDDGPIPGRTESILDVLGRHNAKATFFLSARNDIGKSITLPLESTEGPRIEWQSGIAKKIVDRGHAVANHGHNHFTEDHNFEFIKNNIMQNEEHFRHVIEIAQDRDCFHFFRSPGGLSADDYRNDIPKNVHSINHGKFPMRHVGWDVEFAPMNKRKSLNHLVDVEGSTVRFEFPVDTILKMKQPIALFHDSHWDAHNIESLDRLIGYLGKTFRFPLIPYDIDHEKVKP